MLSNAIALEISMNGAVSVTDLLMFLDCYCYDINQDGEIDIVDLLTLIATWGEC